GVLHGDVTARRIMLTNTGAVKVMGYGQSLLDNQGHRTANPQFAAPEQIREKALDEKTDVYGVGALMYAILTAKSPNLRRERGGGGDDQAVKLPKPSTLNKRIPTALDDLIMACVQRQPAKRPETMYDVVKSLEELARSLRLEDSMLKGVAAPKTE